MPVQTGPFSANLLLRLIDQPVQKRIHVGWMLGRAERCSRQIAMLVDKWESRLVERGWAGVAQLD